MVAAKSTIITPFICEDYLKLKTDSLTSQLRSKALKKIRFQRKLEKAQLWAEECYFHIPWTVCLFPLEDVETKKLRLY